MNTIPTQWKATQKPCRPIQLARRSRTCTTIPTMRMTSMRSGGTSHLVKTVKWVFQLKCRWSCRKCSLSEKFVKSQLTICTMCFHENFQVGNSDDYFLDWPVAFSRENSMPNLCMYNFLCRSDLSRRQPPMSKVVTLRRRQRFKHKLPQVNSPKPFRIAVSSTTRVMLWTMCQPLQHQHCRRPQAAATRRLLWPLQSRLRPPRGARPPPSKRRSTLWWPIPTIHLPAQEWPAWMEVQHRLLPLLLRLWQH